MIFTVSDFLFLGATALALLGVIAHEVVGAPRVLGPLKASGLAPEIVWMHHFSWHVGSVAVLVMSGLFLLAVWQVEGLYFAAAATAMSAGFAVLGVALAVFGDAVLWRTPAPYPWAIVALLGGLGIWLEAGASTV
tara:strand:+ start:14004 stop:14408 length:405 start_codon:yes stop_codon:yes gene_type:complete